MELLIKKRVYADFHHILAKWVFIGSCKSEVQFMSMVEKKNTLVSGNAGDKNIYMGHHFFCLFVFLISLTEFFIIKFAFKELF